MNEHAPSQPHDPAGTSTQPPSESPSARAPLGDEMLRVLSDVERQFESLRRLRTDQESRLGELAQRESELSARAQAVTQAEAALGVRAGELDQRERSVGQMQEQIERLHREAEAERGAMAAARQEAERLLAEAQREREALARERRDVEQARASLERERQEIVAAREQIERDRRDVAASREAIEQELSRLASREQELNLAVAQCDSLRGSVAQYERSIAQRDDAVKAREADLQAREQGLAPREQRAAEREAAAEQVRRQAEADRAQALDADRRAAEANQQCELLRAEVRSAKTQVEAVRGELTQARTELEQARREAEESQRAREQAQHELESARAAAESARQAIEAGRVAAETAGAGLDEALAQARAASHDASQWRERAEHHRTALAEAIFARDLALQAVETATNGPSAADAERIAQELDEARRHGAEMERMAAETARRIRELEGARSTETDRALQELADEVSKRDLVIETLRERLQEASERLETLQSAPGAGVGVGVASIDGAGALFLRQRRTRLANYRRALEAHAGKLVLLREVLAERQKECDDAIRARAELLTQIEELREQIGELRAAPAAPAVNEVDRFAAQLATSSAKKSAGRKASLAVLAWVVVMAALGGTAWLIAGKLAVPTYEARVALAPDEGTSLDESAAEAWGMYQSQLMGDPQFLERAADRMKRRALLDLATPTELAHRLEDDLTIDSSTPGEVRLTLRGQGAERTARTLETLAAAAVGHSNETRGLRTDQATTRTLGAVQTGDQPIEDPRLVVFGIAYGALAAVSLIVFGVAWRLAQSAAARKAQERELREDAVAGEWKELQGVARAAE